MIIAGDNDAGFPRILADQAREFGSDLDAGAQVLAANPRRMRHSADYHVLLPADIDCARSDSRRMFCESLEALTLPMEFPCSPFHYSHFHPRMLYLVYRHQ